MPELSLNTGLRINRDKSKLYLSKGCNNAAELSSILDITVGILPVRYLGLPLSIQHSKAKHYVPLIDKLRSKVDGWMSHCLSFAGRLELMKTILYSTVTICCTPTIFLYILLERLKGSSLSFFGKEECTVGLGMICASLR